MTPNVLPTNIWPQTCLDAFKYLQPRHVRCPAPCQQALAPEAASPPGPGLMTQNSHQNKVAACATEMKNG